MKRQVISKSRKLLGLDQRQQTTSLGFGVEWFQLINSVNRRLLCHPYARSLQGSRANGEAKSDSPAEYSWKIALSTLGAECAHRFNTDPEDLAALQSLFDRNIDQHGNWLTPIDRVEHALKGYTLLYLAQLADDPRYYQAVENLAKSLITTHPHTRDGSLPYVAKTEVILVDTLGMICPFLARYAKMYNNAEALSVSVNQLRQFVAQNVDNDTHLPYHGYYADGPKRLGLHGWGRGTGWYMLGLMDTLIEIPTHHPGYGELSSAYVAAADSLRIFQRGDGHWTWAILHKNDTPDSSTTSLIGYSILRGIQSGILDESFRAVTEAAIHALVRVTRADGVLDNSQGECRGLGKYPQVYGPTLWLQGSATAFAALYLSEAKP